MPQDSLKSVVYRSLVSCDDPNGVAENETIRKSKKRHNSISTTTRKTTPTRNDSYRGDDRNAPQSSSHQLLEVSRGAQNLNHMIDSWSNGSIMNGQHSDDIARDLLRGALDLQDSLIMLCKMQEASKYMSQLKNKHELQIQEFDEVGAGRVDSGRFRIEKVDSGRFGIEKVDSGRYGVERVDSGHFGVDSGRFGIEKVDSGRFGVERVDSGRFGIEKVDSGRYGVERVDSGRFAERIHRGSIENSRLSAGGSSKNCSDELKKVIRDSLSRQNLLPVSSIEENASLNSVSDVPTTSSSHSSTVLSNDFASVDSSLSSTGTQKKAKSRSVIAKLMGLEDFPSEPAQLAPKLPDYEKDLIPRRPISDVEKPKAVNPYFVNRYSDPERTLQEIIETMQFKGLLQSKSKSLSHFPKKSFPKHLVMDDEMPPIVIIKPIRFPSRETKRFSQEEGASLYYKGKSRRMEDERFVQDLVTEEPKVIIEELEVTEENVIEATAQDQEILKSKTMSGGVKAKGETRARKVIREDGNLLSKQILKKPRPKTPEMAATHKTKDSTVTPAPKIEKIEKSNSKVGKIEQTLPTRRKPMQKEIAKASTPARSLEHVRAVSTKVRNTTPNPVLKRSVKPATGNITDQKKKPRTRKAKPVRDSLLDAPIIKTSQCKNGANEIHQADSLSSVSISTSTSTDNQQSTGKDEELEAAKVHMRDYEHEDQTVLGEVTLQIDERSTDISSSEEAKQDFDQKNAIPLPEINMKEFFLSSASFVNYAEDLFDVNGNQLMVVQTTSFEDVGMIKSRLYLDCANEIMEHKSHWNSQSRHPLVKTRFANSRAGISLDGLVEEICNEMEILKSYSKDDGDSIVPVDKLRKMLEIDLKSKEMLGNGGWDLGWTSGFSVDDAEHMIGIMEKEVLSELIDEFITELIC
ncbi:hypothetical protein MKW92_042167 [Papaver armeniacum]|nr:hypothetical protein MKW92_042167 [Papaver armeniacum]